jgi:hypothetical protein
MTTDRIEQFKHAVATGKFLDLLQEIGAYSDLIEILDLAKVAITRRAADAARAAASRKPKKARRSVRLDAVGKEAPPAPVIPTGVVVGIDPGFEEPVMVRADLPGVSMITQMMNDDAEKFIAHEEKKLKERLDAPFVPPEERVFPPNMGSNFRSIVVPKPVKVSNLPPT